MKTILVIDDQTSVLLTLSWLLQAQGYQCMTAETGEDAEYAFTQSTIDGVIVDRTLQGTDGIEVARNLKSIRNVPIIMLTGHPEVPHAGEIDLLLTKPQSPEKLLEAVRNLVGSPSQ